MTPLLSFQFHHVTGCGGVLVFTGVFIFAWCILFAGAMGGGK